MLETHLALKTRRRRLQALASALAGVALMASPARADSGEYEVPTNEALRAYSRMPLTAVDWADDGDHVHLEYDLPAALVGPKVHHVSLEGRRLDGPFLLLRGDGADASCQATSYGATCLVRLRTVQVDADSRTAYLTGTCATPAELTARLAVAARFDGEPIGLVSYFKD